MDYTPLNYALKMLERRDRSVGEIRHKMRLKKFGPEDIEKTVQVLIEKKFLDDEKFARNFVRNQLKIKPIGKFRLEQKLKEKYIKAEIIQLAIDQIDSKSELELAKSAVDRWMKRQNFELKVLDYGEKQKYKIKLSRHLISRGFNWEVVKEVLQKLLNC